MQILLDFKFFKNLLDVFPNQNPVCATVGPPQNFNLRYTYGQMVNSQFSRSIYTTDNSN